MTTAQPFVRALPRSKQAAHRRAARQGPKHTSRGHRSGRGQAAPGGKRCSRVATRLRRARARPGTAARALEDAAGGGWGRAVWMVNLVPLEEGAWSWRREGLTTQAVSGTQCANPARASAGVRKKCGSRVARRKVAKSGKRE